jgi:hypothetical protein
VSVGTYTICEDYVCIFRCVRRDVHTLWRLCLYLPLCQTGRPHAVKTMSVSSVVSDGTSTRCEDCVCIFRCVRRDVHTLWRLCLYLPLCQAGRPHAVKTMSVSSVVSDGTSTCCEDYVCIFRCVRRDVHTLWRLCLYLPLCQTGRPHTVKTMSVSSVVSDGTSTCCEDYVCIYIDTSLA